MSDNKDVDLDSTQELESNIFDAVRGYSRGKLSGKERRGSDKLNIKDWLGLLMFFVGPVVAVFWAGHATDVRHEERINAHTEVIVELKAWNESLSERVRYLERRQGN